MRVAIGDAMTSLYVALQNSHNERYRAHQQTGVNHTTEPRSKALRLIEPMMPKTLIWIIGLLVGAAFLRPGGKTVPAPLPVADPKPMIAAAPTPKIDTTHHGADIVLTRAQDGHFYADGLVNGTAVRFMIDTGATKTALSPQDAQAIGITLSDADFTQQGRGAGGALALMPVMLDRVVVAGADAQNVDAVVVKSGLHVSLLGQSWLKRFDSINIQADTMVLR
jgi:aspartyl protease family protein